MFESDWGLYYYGLRYYSPELGRWVNRDPIGERGGITLYRFVDNSPISEWDRLGLLTLSILPSGPYPSNCGAFDYIRKWLGGGTEILQRIDVWVLIFDCEANLADTELWLFWEHFNAGEIDTWSRTYSDPENWECTQGYGYVSGYALLYDTDVISDPPQSPWIITDPNPNHPANGRPHVDIPPASQDVPPSLPVGVDPAADPYSELLHFSWNCCDGVRQTEFTIPPSAGWSSDGCCQDE
jgi:RHS repeat-associated protein